MRIMIILVLSVVLYHLFLSGVVSFRNWELSLLDLSSLEKVDRFIYLMGLGLWVALVYLKEGF